MEYTIDKSIYNSIEYTDDQIIGKYLDHRNFLTVRERWIVTAMYKPRWQKYKFFS